VNDKTILVIGGAGYVGSHACLALFEAGYKPVVYDSLYRGHKWAVQFGPLEEGDILDRRRLTDVFASHQPKAVLHFAALTFVGESVTDPSSYYRTNVMGTLTLLDVMRTSQVRDIVFSSTAAVYGTPSVTPIPETATLSPINPYGTTKLIIERVLEDYVRAYGFRAAALRYFNAAGADPKGRIGEDHDPESHLIPLVLDAAAGLREAISIFGNDYPTEDGTCIRDYVHVLDLADAHVRALERLMNGTGDGLLGINLGTGQGASVRQVIDAASRITGQSMTVRHANRRVGDPSVLVADPSRANALLDWSAKRPDIETLIKDAWTWHQTHFPKRSASAGNNKT
jgi:UDP-glucose-4-epimerase GalE